MTVKILEGDCREVLAGLPDGSVQCCVTSPPYFGLRDYGVDGQIGLESTVDAFVAEMVSVFREVRRVLRDDGVLFLNLGDSYFGSNQTGGTNSKEGSAKRRARMFSRADGVRGYDTSGTEGSDSQGRGSSSQSLGDARKDARSNRTTGSDARLALAPFAASFQRSRACMEELLDHLPNEDCSRRQPPEQPSSAMPGLVQEVLHACAHLLDVLESTKTESGRQLQDSLTQVEPLSACLWSLRSSVAGAREFVHTLGDASGMPDYMSGIALHGAELARRIQCTLACGSTLLAWLNTPHVQPQNTIKLKPKDMIGIPWRVAFALQQDGWWLRSDCIWHKPNPMPESVTDRPTKSHEYVFLLTKRDRYFYDAEAVKETAVATRMRGPALHPDQVSTNGNGGLARRPLEPERNLRTVWTIATRPYSEAHFATFPPDLAERCIRAGTSERGQCPGCGAPWERVVERTPMVMDRSNRGDQMGEHGRTAASGTMVQAPSSTTTGWAPGCTCDAGDPVRQTVLDPFGGAGTTGLVADRLGRSAILVELNPEYAAMARRRITGDSPMFAEVL